MKRLLFIFFFFSNSFSLTGTRVKSVSESVWFPTEVHGLSVTQTFLLDGKRRAFTRFLWTPSVGRSTRTLDVMEKKKPRKNALARNSISDSDDRTTRPSTVCTHWFRRVSYDRGKAADRVCVSKRHYILGPTIRRVNAVQQHARRFFGRLILLCPSEPRVAACAARAISTYRTAIPSVCSCDGREPCWFITRRRPRTGCARAFARDVVPKYV